MRKKDRLIGLTWLAVWGIGAAAWFGASVSYSSNIGAVLLGILFGTGCSVKFFMELRRNWKIAERIGKNNGKEV